MFGWFRRRTKPAANREPPSLEEINANLPAIIRAASTLLKEWPEFTGRPGGHIETDIAAAASAAGSTLLRSAVPGPRPLPAGATVLADVQDSQAHLLRFMAAAAIEFGLSPDFAGGGPLPAGHEPLLAVHEMVGKLEGPLDRSMSDATLPERWRGHVAAIAAIKLVGAGHEMGLLDQRIGMALAAYHVVAGSKTWSPPAIT